MKPDLVLGRLLLWKQKRHKKLQLLNAEYDMFPSSINRRHTVKVLDWEMK